MVSDWRENASNAEESGCDGILNSLAISLAQAGVADSAMALIDAAKTELQVSQSFKLPIIPPFSTVFTVIMIYAAGRTLDPAMPAPPH